MGVWGADRDKTGLPAGLAWQLLPPFLLVKNWQDHGCGGGLQWPREVGIRSLLLQVKKLRPRERLIFLTLQKGLELLMRPLPSALCRGVVQACHRPGGARLGHASSRLCGGGAVCGSPVRSRPHTPRPGPASPGLSCTTRGHLRLPQQQREMAARGAWWPRPCPGPKETQCPAQALSSSCRLVPHWSQLSFGLLFASHRPQTLSTEKGPGIESKPPGRETEAQKG